MKLIELTEKEMQVIEGGRGHEKKKIIIGVDPCKLVPKVAVDAVCDRKKFKPLESAK